MKYTQTSRNEFIILNEISGPAIPFGLQKSWQDSLKVPDNALPCRFGYCKFMEIQIDYKLRVKL